MWKDVFPQWGVYSPKAGTDLIHKGESKFVKSPVHPIKIEYNNELCHYQYDFVPVPILICASANIN